MTDLEMTKLCAEAMGFHIAFGTDQGKNPFWCHLQWPDPDDNGGLFKYDPLHDDAQAMALGKAHPEDFEAAVTEWASMKRCGENPNLNRILCEMVTRK